jgi:hypothetical protein
MGRLLQQDQKTWHAFNLLVLLSGLTLSCNLLSSRFESLWGLIFVPWVVLLRYLRWEGLRKTQILSVIVIGAVVGLTRAVGLTGGGAWSVNYEQLPNGPSSLLPAAAAFYLIEAGVGALMGGLFWYVRRLTGQTALPWLLIRALWEFFPIRFLHFRSFWVLALSEDLAPSVYMLGDLGVFILTELTILACGYIGRSSPVRKRSAAGIALASVVLYLAATTGLTRLQNAPAKSLVVSVVQLHSSGSADRSGVPGGLAMGGGGPPGSNSITLESGAWLAATRLREESISQDSVNFVLWPESAAQLNNPSDMMAGNRLGGSIFRGDHHFVGLELSTEVPPYSALVHLNRDGIIKDVYYKQSEMAFIEVPREKIASPMDFLRNIFGLSGFFARDFKVFSIEDANVVPLICFDVFRFNLASELRELLDSTLPRVPTVLALAANHSALRTSIGSLAQRAAAHWVSLRLGVPLIASVQNGASYIFEPARGEHSASAPKSTEFIWRVAVRATLGEANHQVPLAPSRESRECAGDAFSPGSSYKLP